MDEQVKFFTNPMGRCCRSTLYFAKTTATLNEVHAVRIFDFFLHSSIQIKRLLYTFSWGRDEKPVQVTRYANLLQNNSSILKTGLQTLVIQTKWFALANHADKTIYLSGGFSNNLSSKLAFAFDLKTGKWHDDLLPMLNRPRENHSSCCLGDSLYAFCGSNESGYLRSIELLDLRQLKLRRHSQNDKCYVNSSQSNRDKKSWTHLFELEALSPRRNAVLCQLSESSILIMGGYDATQLLSDAVIFDMETREAKIVVASGL